VNSPIRIAFCITDLDPGGAERALVQLVTRLDRTRWDPAVYCLSKPGTLVEALERAGISVTCLGARGVRDIGALFQLRRELKRFGPKLVQTFLFHANILGRLAAAWAGVPHCVSGIRVAEKRSRWPLYLDRATNRFVETNVCVSRAVAEFSSSAGGLSRSKLVVIPNGVDVATFADAPPVDRAEVGIPADARIILAVGRLDPQKGLEFLIESAASLVTRFPDVHFLLVGGGSLRGQLVRQLADLRLQSRVHFCGWRPDIPSVMKLACGLALPSLWEGMPNVVLEAMAAGLPVVASDVEGVAELVVPGETGFLVPSKSVEDLTNALSKLLSDPERARRMGQAGQRRVASEFSWDRMAAAYAELYEKLIA
jgi:glycosyltransferase involved in cell wall biosynthesis